MSCAALRPETETRVNIFLLVSEGLFLAFFPVKSEFYAASRPENVPYRQCVSDHACFHGWVVHRFEHLKLWRLKEHYIGQELRGPQHFEGLELYNMKTQVHLMFQFTTTLPAQQRATDRKGQPLAD